MQKLTCSDFNEVLDKAKLYIKSEVHLNKITKAYEYAKKKHEGQVRKNGDPYLYHLISTAYNLTLWHLDPPSIQAGFLHDILEDTPTTFEELENEFDTEIASLVLAVTKVSHFAKENRAEIKSDYLRKLYLSLAHDIRVIIIKMADRLHNIRTINFLNPEKQMIIARETLEVYSSIAHRLGMRELQLELEDRSFAVLYPNEYKTITGLMEADRENNEKLVTKTINEIKKILGNYPNLKFLVYGRSKNLFSIYRKMYHFGKNFDEIHDLLAIRIVTSTLDDCYAILGYLHQSFTPLVGRFKDYIATPKNNMYQSLHTSMIFDNQIYEFQIRTEEMEILAEVGAAAHWRYKEGEVTSAKKKQQEIDEKLNIFQEILDLNNSNVYDDNPLNDNSSVESKIKQDLFSELIYVLTPQGRVVTLPRNSTVLDFAYKVHTEIGEKTMGARINGGYSSLNTILKTGDVVEVKTSKNVKPSYDWLNIAKTHLALNKIKKFLHKQHDQSPQKSESKDQQKQILEIKTQIDKYIQDNNLRWRIAKGQILQKRLKILKYNDYEEFCLDIANGLLTVGEAVETVLFNDAPNFKDLKQKTTSSKTLSNSNDAIVGNDIAIQTNLAQCCLPIPEEPIMGYITKGQGIKVHRISCPNVSDEDKKARTVTTIWNPNVISSRTYLTGVKIYFVDRPGLLADVVNILNHLKVSIQAIDANNQFINQKGVLKVMLKVSSIEKLKQVTLSIKKIPDIIEITRIIM